MKTLVSSVLIIFFSIGYLYANVEQGAIRGKIVDQATNEPIMYASAVLRVGNTVITGILSEENGSFEMKNIPFGTYDLEVSFIGYISYKTTLSLTQRNLDVQNIRLQQSATQLNEVVVTATATKETVNIEKTTINTSRAMGAATGSILDVLQTSSSINVGNEGNVSIRGNSNVLILINGVPTTIDALGSIPASASQKIEIITSPDVKHDAEGTGGIINIITKKNETTAGYNGMLQANYGFYNRINGAAALNYSSQKINLGLTYNGRYEKNENTSTLHRLFYSSGNSIRQHISSFQKNTNNVAGLNFTYRHTPQDIFTLEGRALFPNISNNQFLTITSNTTQTRENLIDFNRKVVEGKFGYERIISPDKTKLSFIASISKTKGDRPAKYYEEGEIIQRSEGGGAPFQFNAQADYTTTIGKNIKIESGLKYSFRNNYFKYDSWIYDAPNWIHSDFFSSDLEHNESVFAGYFLVASRLKKLGYKAGIRLEYSQSHLSSKIDHSADFDSDNLFVSPYLSLNYPLNDKSKFEFTFSRRITRPTYPQLNPFINMIDAITYETGNRQLKPETTNKIDFGYSFSGNSFQLQSALYYNYSKDFIVQISKLYDADALMLSYINGTSDSRFGLDIFTNFPILPQLTVSMALNVFYAESKYDYQSIKEKNSGWMSIGNVALTAKPTKTTEIELRYFYNSQQYFPQFIVGEHHYLNIGVKQNFAKNKFTASVLLTDVFNTREWNIKSDNQVYRLQNFSKDQSRILWIGLTYRINSFKPLQPKQSQDDNRNIIKLGQ